MGADITNEDKDVTNEDKEKMPLKKKIVLLWIQLYCEYWEYLDILLKEKFLLNPCMKNNIYLPHCEKIFVFQQPLVFPAVLNIH